MFIGSCILFGFMFLSFCLCTALDKVAEAIEELDISKLREDPKGEETPQ